MLNHVFCRGRVVVRDRRASATRRCFRSPSARHRTNTTGLQILLVASILPFCEAVCEPQLKGTHTPSHPHARTLMAYTQTCNYRAPSVRGTKAAWTIARNKMVLTDRSPLLKLQFPPGALTTKTLSDTVIAIQVRAVAALLFDCFVVVGTPHFAFAVFSVCRPIHNRVAVHQEA